MPLSLGPCLRTTTSTSFGHTTPSRVGVAPSPSLDRLAYRPMEPSDPDASPRGHRGYLCAIHSWGPCPNRVAPEPGSSSSGRQGEAEGGEEEDKACRITVVTGLIGVPVIRQTTRITISPRGRPQGPMVSQTTTTPPTSPTLYLVTPPPLTLPPTDAGPSSSGTLSDLLSPCGNQVLRWFARFTAPTGKGRVPGSWDSTAGPSR
jgi:hypothetical protein